PREHPAGAVDLETIVVDRARREERLHHHTVREHHAHSCGVALATQRAQRRRHLRHLAEGEAHEVDVLGGEIAQYAAPRRPGAVPLLAVGCGGAEDAARGAHLPDLSTTQPLAQLAVAGVVPE